MIFRSLGIVTASFILTACGGSGSSAGPSIPEPFIPEPPVKETFTPDLQSIESVAFVDALNKPLALAEVVFTPVNEISSFAGVTVGISDDISIGEGGSCDSRIEETSLTDMTGNQGDLILEGLAAGIYQVHICKGGARVSMQFTILSENSAVTAVIAAPLIVDEEGDATVFPDSIIVAVSGVIYSDEGTVANAQIAISGGASTNGAITTAITDENGFYSIVINVNESKLLALQNATIQVVAEGFASRSIEGQDFTQFGAFSGVNVELTAVTEDAAVLAYEETFEVLSTDAACGAWTSEVLMEDSLWHTHISGLNVINQAYLANLVSLAPNDLSAGNVPDPSGGLSACWYGKTASDGSIEEGNFLNETIGGDGDSELSGGRSANSHAGALISPIIDFSAEVAPLALTFKTWWEIEAVNPSESGFDIMSVEYQIEGEENWNIFIHLNPLTDPAGNDLVSLPYSNAGFNQAPIWLEQEPISLDRLAGKVFKLRFSFSTKDGLFNGFRGWLLDDVKISHEEGTFPLWDEVDRILNNDEELFYTEIFNNETGETQFSVDLTVSSLDSVSAQLRIYPFENEPLLEAFAITALDQGELQDIQLQGDITKPEGAFFLVVEMLDALGQIKASYIFGGEGAGPSE